MTSTPTPNTLNEPRPTVAPPRSVRWWGPRWSRARELGKLAPSVLGARSIGRIAVISLVIGAGLCIGALVAFPYIPPAVFWQALVAIPLGLAPLPLLFLVHLWCPQIVGISKKYVTVQHGQSNWHAKLSEIEQAELIVLSDEHLLLRLRVRGKLHRIGVSPTADLRGLTALLSMTVVLDLRRQFAAARLLVEQARSDARLPNTPDSTVDVR